MTASRCAPAHQYSASVTVHQSHAPPPGVSHGTSVRQTRQSALAHFLVCVPAKRVACACVPARLRRRRTTDPPRATGVRSACVSAPLHSAETAHQGTFTVRRGAARAAEGKPDRQGRAAPAGGKKAQRTEESCSSHAEGETNRRGRAERVEERTSEGDGCSRRSDTQTGGELWIDAADGETKRQNSTFYY